MFFYRCRRVVVVLTICCGLLLSSTSLALAAPTADEPASPNVAMQSWPAELRQLVNGTTEFKKGPWFTDTGCKAKGGAVGKYMNTYFDKEKDFTTRLIADTNPKAADLMKTTIEEFGFKFDVFPNGNPAYDMAEDVCAADLTRWNGASAESVWGAKWAVKPDKASLDYMLLGCPKGFELNAAELFCRDMTDLTHQMTPAQKQQFALDKKRTEELRNAKGDNGQWINPEKTCEAGELYCSRATWADCSNATAGDDQARCMNWNLRVQVHLEGLSNWIESNKSFSDRVGSVFAAVGTGLYTAGKWVLTGLGWVAGLVGKAIGWVAKKGMEQVVAFFVEGTVWVWGVFTSWVVNFTTPNLAGGGFVTVYNMVSGIMLLMAFLLWLAGFIIAWRRGQFGRSIVSGLKAIFGVQMIGVVAFLLVGLAREATQLLIDANQQMLESADFAGSLLGVNPVFGLIVAIAGFLGTIAAFILLLFNVPMVFGHTMFGTVAAAGQANSATEGWLRNWFFRFLSLVWTPFFMVAVMIMCQWLTASTDSNTKQNLGQQMVSVFAGAVMMIALPFTPKILQSLMHGATSVALGAAEAIGASYGAKAAGGVAKGAGSAGGAALEAASGSGAALATMASNLQALSSWDNDSWGGGQIGGFGDADAGDGGGGAAADGGPSDESGVGSLPMDKIGNGSTDNEPSGGELRPGGDGENDSTLQPPDGDGELAAGTAGGVSGQSEGSAEQTAVGLAGTGEDPGAGGLSKPNAGAADDDGEQAGTSRDATGSAENQAELQQPAPGSELSTGAGVDGESAAAAQSSSSSDAFGGLSSIGERPGDHAPQAGDQHRQGAGDPSPRVPGFVQGAAGDTAGSAEESAPSGGVGGQAPGEPGWSQWWPATPSAAAPSVGTESSISQEGPQPVSTFDHPPTHASGEAPRPSAPAAETVSNTVPPTGQEDF